ncbi:MAG: nitroreductase family protein, partial [Dehalococcoidia bacterium]|nr:nitroreductase family protein [Dehalococcoidia bacterium]
IFKEKNVEAIKVIQRRASLKACLSGKEIDKGAIQQVLEAARVAPSGRNQQPSRIVVVNDKKIIDTLVKESFSEGNAIIAQAPVLIFICANPKDSINRDGQSYYLFDAGLAMENLLLAATDLGLATHPMTGFNEAKARQILGIPEDIKIVAATPLSCTSQSSYNEAAKDRLASRTRKNLEDIVFWNSWEANK